MIPARPQLRRALYLGFLCASFLLLCPFRAAAHLPSVGLGPVYDGIFHFLLSAEDLIPVIGLSLLSGQRGTAFGRRVMWLLPLTWFIGGMLGTIRGSGQGSWLTVFSFLLIGGLVAASARITLKGLSVLAGLLGLFHGYLNGAGMNSFTDSTYVLIGTIMTVFAIVALFTSFVIPLHRYWTLIVIRVAGSWIAATGLLMFGWAFRQHG